MNNTSYSLRFYIFLCLFFVLTSSTKAQKFQNIVEKNTDSFTQIGLFSFNAITLGNKANLKLADFLQMNKETMRYNIVNTKPGSSGLGIIELLGPSINFPLTINNNLYIATKTCAYGNFWNIDGRLLAEINEPYRIEQDYPYHISPGEKMGMNLAAWHELSLGLSHKFINNTEHIIKTTIQLNYLKGITHVANSMYFSGGTVDLDPKSYLTNATGTIQTTTSDNILSKSSLSELLKGKSSLSFNAGISYTRKTKENKPYLFRTGFFLKDIGKLSFTPDSAYSREYDITLEKERTYFNKHLNQFEINHISTYLELSSQAFQQTSVTKNDYNVTLPTRIQLFFDYRFRKEYGLHTNLQLSAVKKNKTTALWAGNKLFVAPYYQDQNKFACLLLGYASYSKINMGLFFQYKGFSIGSESIFSALINSSQQLDIQLNFTFSIHHQK